MVQEVVDFCKSYLEVNREAFCDPRLELVINDARFLAHPPTLLMLVMMMLLFEFIYTYILFNLVNGRAELESREECVDVIIGDLADPIKGGPCYQLYTKSFYESTVKPRLTPGGIFVTQVGFEPTTSRKSIPFFYLSLAWRTSRILVYSYFV